MKKEQQSVDKVAVIHAGEGLEDKLRSILLKKIGCNQIKIVNVKNLVDEFEFQKKAQIVICLPSVAKQAGNVAKEWKDRYDKSAYIIAIGDVAVTDEIDEVVLSVDDLKFPRPSLRA